MISTIISISILKIVQIFINIWYCNHFSHSKIFRFIIYLFSKSTFVFCLDVKFNINFSKFCFENRCFENIKNFLRISFINIQNQNHFFCLKIFKNYIYFFINYSFFSNFNDDVKITKFENFNFKSLSIMLIKLRNLKFT